MSSNEYNQLLKFLYFEGYADSYAEAEELLESMTDDEFEYVVEAAHSFPLSPSERRSAENIGRMSRGDYSGSASNKSAKATEPVQPKRKKRKLEFEVKEDFAVVAEYLFIEGFADTIENAEVMAENISETWVNGILEARASEKRGLGSPESPLSYPGRKTQQERGRKGGRHQYSGSVEYGGSATERGRKKSDPQSQAQRLRRLSTYPEKPGKYSGMQTKKRDLGSRFD
jgi:hypothetical protein